MAPNDKSKEYNMFVEEKKDQSNDEKINKDELDAETKLWSELPVDAWKQSVLNEDSIFHDLYLDTRRRLVEACKEHNYDVIIEVGCGTGEVIAHVADAGVPRIGVDINETFVKHFTAQKAAAKKRSKSFAEKASANPSPHPDA